MIRAPRKLVAGLALIVLAAVAVWATGHLGQGTLRAMGPAMFPRWVAILVGLCGVVLVIISLARDGEAMDRWPWRGPVLVSAAIFLFALTIREFGLAVAGPLAVVVGGFAAPDARAKELVVFALAITAFCIVLFHSVLDLAMPILVIPGTAIAL